MRHSALPAAPFGPTRWNDLKRVSVMNINTTTRSHRRRTTMAGTLLIAYDGSADANTALEYAAKTFAGREAVVLTVWEPLMAQMSLGEAFAGVTVTEDEEAVVEQSAEQVAEG